MYSRVAYLGVAFVLVGAALLVSPTLGFETIAADRTTQIETASDQNALIGFETTGESIDSVGDTATVFTLRNNAEETLTVSMSTDVAQSGDVEVDTSGSGEVPAGGTTDVVLRCNGASGTGNTTVTTTVTQATGETMTITGASSSTSIDYTCEDTDSGPPGSGPASFVANDPHHDGGPWSQVFEVNVGSLGNNDEFTIDLSDAQANAGVDYNSATAQITSGQGYSDFEFDKNSWTITYSPQGKTDGPFEITVSDIQITSDQDGTAHYSDSTGESDSDTFAVPYVADSDQSGDIDTSGDLQAGDDVTVDGDVDAGEDMSGGDRITVNGDTDVDGDIETGNSAKFDGNLDAGGDVSTGDRTTVSGDVDTGGGFTSGADSTVEGDIDTAGTVTLGDRTIVEGNLDTDGSLTVGNDAEIQGDVEATGDVDLGTRVSVEDDLDTDGTLYLGCNVDVGGDISAAGGVVEQC